MSLPVRSAQPVPPRGTSLASCDLASVSRCGLAAVVWGLFAAHAHAQISLTTAVDLALRNSPRVQMAQDDIAKAESGVSQARDAYIPSIVLSSSALGDSHGFPLGLPTVFAINAQSLVFSYSQRDYMRAASSGLLASSLSLKDVREQVEEDTVVTYLALDADQRKRTALTEQAGHAARLRDIVQDRLDAGLDSAGELTRAKRTVVQLRLQVLQLEDEIASYTDHLARLVGLPGNPVTTITESIPTLEAAPSAASPADSFAVQAAFADARSKREQAFGDSRYTLRPQIAFGLQYSRFSTYNNNYATYYPGIQNQPDAIGAALDITFPFFDMGRRAKARESFAAAAHAQHEALYAQAQSVEGRLKLEHSTAELAARAELAQLDRDLAQQQLDAILVQLEAASNGSAPAINPRDEQNARIQERQRFIEMLDADSLLRQTRVNLLRQSGQLETWLRNALTAAPVAKP